MMDVSFWLQTRVTNYDLFSFLPGERVWEQATGYVARSVTAMERLSADGRPAGQPRGPGRREREGGKKEEAGQVASITLLGTRPGRRGNGKRRGIYTASRGGGRRKRKHKRTRAHEKTRDWLGNGGIIYINTPTDTGTSTILPS